MGTFPSAADIPRGIPVGTDSVAGAQPAPPPVISTAGADAAAVAARSTASVAGELDDYGRQLDVLAAQDAVNKFRAVKTDYTYGDNGFMKIQGVDVLKKDEGGMTVQALYPTKLQDAAGGIPENLSPRARALYNERVGSEMESYKSELLRHVMTQTEVANKAVYKDTTTALMTEAQRNSDNLKQLDGIASQVELATRNYAASAGLPGDSLAKAARSNVYRTAIEDKISRNDGPGALALYNAVNKDLDGNDAVEMQRQIKTVEVGQIARNFVADVSGATEARVNMGIKYFEDAGYGRKVGAGIVAGYLHESGFRTDNPNPRDGADGSDSINIAHWNSTRAVEFHKFAADNKLDENDPATGLKFTQVEIDRNPALKAKLIGAANEADVARIMTKEFFIPKDAAARGEERAATATKILANYNRTAPDPMLAAVNAASPVPGATAEGPPGFLDTRRQMIEAETWRLNATAKNQSQFGNNPAQLAANQSLIATQYEARARAIQVQKDTLNANVQDWVTKPGAGGGPQTERPPPAIWNQLTFEQQRSIDSTLTHNAKGADRITDQPTWYQIQRGLTANDPNERAKWADAPLWQYRDKLSNSDFQELAKMQGTARLGDPNREFSHVRGLNQMVDDTLNTMGIDPTPKGGSSGVQDATKGLEFRRAVQDNVAQFERTKGAKSTPEEQQKIIDGLVRATAVPGRIFGTNDKPAYQVKIADVPKTERAKIEEALRITGQPVTDSAIVDLFTRANPLGRK